LNVPKVEALANLYVSIAELWRDPSPRFGKSCFANIACCLGASGSATGTRARNSHPQTRRVVAPGKRNLVFPAMGGACASQ